MYVVEIIPLKRGIQKDTLTYFSSDEYSIGTILTIPIRNTNILGIVTDVRGASTTKTALRAATFSLRKLPQQEGNHTLTPAFISTAEELARHYAASQGSVLFNLLPPMVRSGDISLPHVRPSKADSYESPEIFGAKKKERHLLYRSLVRETFAHSGSIVFVVPSTPEADELFRILAQGIEERTILLTSGMSKKDFTEAYAELEDFTRTKLIITTPTHSILERHDITVVVLEHSRSTAYREHTRPYIDYRDALSIHAKYSGRRLILGDILHRSEEEYARREERSLTLGEVQKRIELKGELSIIQMKDKPDGRNPFTLFSPKVIEAIKETRRKRGRTFLFAPHRGLAPVVACLDCGHIFRSEENGEPYSLIRIKKGGTEERWFVSGSTGSRMRAPDTCSECGSWRLKERGVGIQYVYDELTKHIDSPVILFDHTTAGTYKKACFLRDTFENTKGSLMVGTRMALPYFTKDIGLSVIVNMDALYATPTWRLQEENFGLLLELREKTSGTLFVQTRVKDEHLLKQAKQGGVQEFYTEEIELRKTFNYPPFTVFIHMAWQNRPGSKDAVGDEIKHVLKEYDVQYYNAPPGAKGVTTRYGLIRKAAKDWPDQKLASLLKTLSPAVRIMINPDRIV